MYDIRNWDALVSSPEHNVLKVSFCDTEMSVVRRRPSSINNFFKRHLLLNCLANFTGMILGSPSTKIAQIVPVYWTIRSWGPKRGSKNANLKNLLVWNRKAQNFHIWHVALSSGPLQRLPKLCPWGQNWPRPGGHQFYIELYRGILKKSSCQKQYGLELSYLVCSII